MKIGTLLRDGNVHLSCEVFPPKKFDGIAQASQVAREIADLHPAFMSVTYGAAGSTPGHTLAVAQAVAERGVTPLCHLTCVQSTKEHVQQVLTDMRAAGLENVLALRGDLPTTGEPCKDFAYASFAYCVYFSANSFLPACLYFLAIACSEAALLENS